MTFLPSDLFYTITMFRIAARHLLAPQLPARPLSTTSILSLKQGKAKNPFKPSTNAPRPPPVPESIDSSTQPIHLEPIEPVVHSNAPTPPSADPSISPSQTTTPDDGVQAIPVTPPPPPPSSAASSSTPLTPPPPPPTPTPPLPPSSTPPAEDATPDYSTLPSLSLAVDSQPLIAEPSSKGGRTGAGRKEYVSSIEKQRRLLLRWSLAGLAVGGLGLVYTLGDDNVRALPYCRGRMADS